MNRKTLEFFVLALRLCFLSFSHASIGSFHASTKHRTYVSIDFLHPQHTSTRSMRANSNRLWQRIVFYWTEMSKKFCHRFSIIFYYWAMRRTSIEGQALLISFNPSHTSRSIFTYDDIRPKNYPFHLRTNEGWKIYFFCSLFVSFLLPIDVNVDMSKEFDSSDEGATLISYF